MARSRARVSQETALTPPKRRSVKDMAGNPRVPFRALRVTALALIVGSVGVSGPAAADEPSWSPPARLGAAVVGDAPEVVTDAAGTDTAAWSREAADGTTEVVAARRPVDGAWSSPVVLGESSAWAHVAMAGSSGGEVAVVWSGVVPGQTDTARSSVHVATWSYDGWSAPQRLWQGRKRVAAVDVAVTGDGSTAIATWGVHRDPAGTGARVLAAVRDGSGSWQATQRLDSGTHSFVARVWSGVADTGRGGVVWTGDSRREQIRSSVWTGSRWRASRRVATHSCDDVEYLVKPDGSAAVVLTRAHVVRARLADRTGHWGPQTVLAGGPDARTPRHGVALAAGPGDRWQVAWGAGGHRIRVREYADGAWLARSPSLWTDGRVREPQLRYAADGRLLVAWNENLGTGRRSRIRAVTRATRWSAPVTVSGERRWLNGLRLAGNDDGHLVLVWNLVRPSRTVSATGAW